MRRMIWAGLALASLLASGCGKRYWTPAETDRAVAEQHAKLQVWARLSDHAAQAPALDLDPATGLPRSYPLNFTIGGTPFSRYRLKFWGGIHDGRKLVHVQYFDPQKIPDWEKKNAKGLFPAYFEVVVDPSTRQVVAIVAPDK